MWEDNGTDAQKFSIWKLDSIKDTIRTASVELEYVQDGYNGKEHIPEVIVKKDSVELIKDTDFKIKYTNNINAGTATVTITGAGKYTGTITKQFTINKASQKLSVTIDKTNLSIGETAQIKVAGQGTINYQSSASDKVTVNNAGVVTGKSAGSATITVTASGTQNYNSAQKKITINVQKNCVGNRHEWNNGQITTKATCTEQGVKTYTCTICGNTKVETIPATGHSWNNGKITKNATCTIAGTKTYTCNQCKKTKTETIKAAGHKEVKDTAVKATCEKAGKTEGSHCSVCNAVIKAQTVVKALGHSWNNGKVTKAATCTKAGTKTYTCSRCKKTKTETIKATGHKEVKDAAVKATCEKAGKTEGSHCGVCNVVLKAQTVVKALGHSWNNGKVTKTATCTKAGTKTYTCSRCKKTKTETIKATGHKEVKDAAVKATCEKTGKTEGSHCSVCNTVIKAQTVVKATGHKWNYGKITKKATCTTAGIKTYTCTICKKNRTESIPKTGHTKITKFAKKASCTAEGYTGDIYCKVCGELLEKGNVVEQLPHTWSSWNKLSNATVMNPEKQQRTCTVCKTTETRNNGSKLKSVMKVNYSTITLKTKQSTNTLQVSGMNKGDYVASVKSANTGIVKVTKYTKDGKIQLSAQGKAGNTKITICLAGGAVKDIIVKVTIIKTTALKISFRKATIKVGSAKAVKTTVVPANSQEKVTYASSASKVATVTNKGVINAKKRGTAKITVKSGSKTEIITVTVE